MMQPDTTKIQTLNLWHNPIEYETRTEGVAKRVNQDKPDVLCLQEVTFPPDAPSTAELIANRTGMRIVAAHPQENPHRIDGVRTGNAILTRLPLLDKPSIASRENSGYRPTDTFIQSGFQPLYPNRKREMSEAAIWSWLKTRNGNELLVVTTHLSWGVFNEYQRLQEAIDVNQLVSTLTKDNPYVLTVLGLSANAEPDSDSARFLKGKVAIENVDNFWVDVWDYANNEEHGDGETQTPRNVWSKVMAAQQGTLLPAHLPKRRIDYLFVRDWVYGQNGSPISTRIAFSEPLGVGVRPDATVSDHYGVEGCFADLPRNPDYPARPSE